jgi:hypothetical protein
MNNADIVNRISHYIGLFYKNKFAGIYNKERIIWEILSLNIHSIVFDCNIITITLGTPGVIIGKKGENLRELEAFLKTQLEDVCIISGILLEEDNSISWLLNTFEED